MLPLPVAAATAVTVLLWGIILCAGVKGYHRENLALRREREAFQS
jgi:hypothetical protein